MHEVKKIKKKTIFWKCLEKKNKPACVLKPFIAPAVG